MKRAQSPAFPIVFGLLLALFVGASLFAVKEVAAQTKDAGATASYIDVTKVPITFAPAAPNVAAASAVPASQPAGSPAAQFDAVSRLVLAFVEAVKGHCWPVAIALFAAILLWFERTFKGLLGERSTKWLTSRPGIIITSVVGGVGTAFAGTAAGGWTWQALGMAALSGLLVGATNAAMLHSTKPTASPSP